MNDHLKRPDIIVNQRPCRTGLLLLFIVLAMAVIGFDRAATTAALKQIEVEKHTVAQVPPLCEALTRLTRELEVKQERFDKLEEASTKVLKMYMTTQAENSLLLRQLDIREAQMNHLGSILQDHKIVPPDFIDDLPSTDPDYPKLDPAQPPKKAQPDYDDKHPNRRNRTDRST